MKIAILVDSELHRFCVEISEAVHLMEHIELGENINEGHVTIND